MDELSSPVPVQRKTHQEKVLALQERIKSRNDNVKRITEKKRLRDFNKIQSMISPNEDGINPFSLSPEEVWDIILSFLYDPEDLENARKTCTSFEGLLEKRRFVDILLPKVFRIEYFRRLLRSGQKWNGEIRNSLWRYVENDDILHQKHTTWDRRLQVKFRGLSKSLRETMDTNMEKILNDEADYQFRLEGNSYNHRKVWGLNFRPGSGMYAYKNCFYSFVKNVDSAIIDSPAKRLVGKTLKVYLNEENNCRQHVQDLSGFIDLVGYQILHCNLTITGNVPIATVEAYNHLRDWALRMPNIKWLHLDLKSGEADLNATNVAIRRRSFPTLSNLKRFSFLFYYNFESEVAVAIIAANQHLEELVIEQKSHSPKEFKRIVPFARALNLTSISFSTHFWGNFEQLFNPVWPLRKIHFRFKRLFCINEGSVTAASIFEVLQYYSKTLTHVSLDVFMYKWWVRKPLKLPNVTNFSLKFTFDDRVGGDDFETMEVFNNIDFLIPMKKLQELTWINAESYNYTFERSQVLELIKFERGRYNLCSSDSNIWDVFPRLKSVIVEVNNYTPRKTFWRANREK